MHFGTMTLEKALPSLPILETRLAIATSRLRLMFSP
jgi:hypothetical protein